MTTYTESVQTENQPGISSERSSGEIYFKVVFTCNTARYNFNPSTTFDDFMNIVKPKINRDFGINEFELVECGQRIHGIRSEDAPALVVSNATLFSKYGPNLDVSFYIRPIVIPSRNLEELQDESTTNNQLLRCVVCMERPRSILFRPCNHLSTCRTCSYNSNISSCPVCRIQIDERIDVYIA